MWMRALLLFGLVACSADESPGVEDADGGNRPADGSSAGEPAELAGMTAAHNQVRADHGVAPLSWDADLARIAQDWAERCVDGEEPIGLIDHNPGRSDDYPAYVGENVYGASGETSGTDAVAAWAGEEADYDYDANTCEGVCGHYTQIVWAGTTAVGCGVHTCPGLTFGYTIVCNYAPGGNTGGRPY